MYNNPVAPIIAGGGAVALAHTGANLLLWTVVGVAMVMAGFVLLRARTLGSRSEAA